MKIAKPLPPKNLKSTHQYNVVGVLDSSNFYKKGGGWVTPQLSMGGTP